MKNLISKLKINKKWGFMMALTMMVSLSITNVAFAATVTPAATDYSAIKDALASAITPQEIISVIAAILAAATSLAILWWGSRKLVRAVVTAFKTGKIKF